MAGGLFNKLITQNSNLRLLKFGKDLPGAGTSRQPYVTKPLPGVEDPLPTNSPDFLLRQGTLQRIADDETRFFKYFSSTKGLAFTAKQNLLSLTSVRTQASQGPSNQGTYLPTNTSAQLAANPFGGHLNFLGVDPTGLLGGIRKYGEVITPTQINDDNRLVTLQNNLIQNRSTGNFGFIKGTTINPLPGVLYNYNGGPGAVEGKGKTDIKRYVNTLDLGKTGDNNNILRTQGTSIVTGVRTYTQEDLLSQDKPKTPGVIRQDFRKILRDRENGIPGSNPTSITDAPDYLTKNWEQRTNAGSPGVGDFTRGSSYTTGRGTALDKINALPIYQSTTGNADKNKPINDLIKFRIAVVNNDSPSTANYIHFRAFIDSFSDSYTTQWSGERYPGRGEEFFRYGGFGRGISLSFTVAAQSKQELIPMYKKLNYLASATMNDYSPSGYMRAPFIRLTIGGYLYEQFGFLKGINYGWEMGAPFEIGLNDTGGEDTDVKELPHVIRVTGFNFQPIYNFLPQQQKFDFGDSNNPKEGRQRYIALKTENTNWFPENGEGVTDFGAGGAGGVQQ